MYVTSNGLLKFASMVNSLEGNNNIVSVVIRDVCTPDDGPTANTILEHFADYTERATVVVCHLSTHFNCVDE